MKNFFSDFLSDISTKISEISFINKIIVVFVIFWIVNAGIIGYSHFLRSTPSIERGEPSPTTISSPRNIEVEDKQKTEQLKEKARERVETVYEVDPGVETAVFRKIDDAFSLLYSFKNKETTLTTVVAQFEEKGFDNFSKNDINNVTSMSRSSLENVHQNIKSTFRTLFALRIKPDELDLAKSKAKDVLSASDISERGRKLAEKFISAAIAPNYLPDEEETERLRKEAENSVNPVIISKKKNEVVIREGEVVSREDALILESLGILKRALNIPQLISLIFLTGLIQLSIFIYIRLFSKKNYFDIKRLLLAVALFTLYNVFSRVLIGTPYETLAPLALPVIVGNIMLGPTATVPLIFSSLSVSFVYPQVSIPLLLVLLGGGISALFLTLNISQHRQLLTTGIYLSLIMGVLGTLTSLYFNFTFQDAIRFAAGSLINGFLATVLALGLLPFLESAFHITTAIRLLEIATPNHALLKELMTNAPGTYNHSIMTANLAEAAAEEVGANSLLVRAASYFHDVGKLKRPMFFSENQASTSNPHDKTNPSLSRLVISSHVKDGKEIARMNKLPQEIVDIIEQHHGTSLMKYFYNKAVEESEKEKEIKEESFRYGGNKPTTKEAAIVMLADSVEAASRTLSKRTPERMEQLVRSIVKEKLYDGQLDKSNLNLQELEVITQSFTRVLVSLYHERVKYPENIEKNKQKKNNKKRKQG